MNEPLLKYVLENLNRSRGQLRTISDQTGVPYTTLRNIYKGVTPNPGVNQVQALADYFSERVK